MNTKSQFGLGLVWLVSVIVLNSVLVSRSFADLSIQWNGSVSSDMSNVANYNPVSGSNVLPSGTDRIYFNVAFTNQPVYNGTQNYAVRGFMIAQNGANLNLTSANEYGFTLGTFGIDASYLSAGHTPTIAANLEIGASQTWKIGAGGVLNISGNITGADAYTLQYGDSSGGAASGTIKLSGANLNTNKNFTNNFINGTIVLDNANALGNGLQFNTATHNSSATLDLNGFSASVGHLRGGAGFSIVNSSPNLVTLTTSATAASFYGDYKGTISGAIQLVYDFSAITGNADLDARAATGNGTYNYTGGTVIKNANTSGALVRIASSTRKIAGALTFDNSNIRITDAGTVVDNDLTIVGSNTLQFMGANQSLTGAISGAADAVLNMAVGSSDASISGNLSNYKGTLAWNQKNNAALTLTGAAANAGSVKFENNAAMQSAEANVSLGALSGSGALKAAGAGAVTYTVGGANTNATFSGVIQKGTGTVNISKEGAGVWELSGASGNQINDLSVSGGTLLIAATGNIAGANTVSVSGGRFVYNSATSLSRAVQLNGATSVLAGTGVINSAVTLNGGGVIQPGYDSVGKLTINSNVAWSGLVYDWDIANFAGATGGVDFDLLSISGGLTLSGNNTVNISALNPADFASDKSWTIMTASSGITDNSVWNFTGGPAGIYSVLASGNNLILNFTVIPEPSTGTLLVIGAGLLAVAARLRARR